MISKVIFKKVTFCNINSNKFKKYILKNGLFVFPAGPALANIEKSKLYTLSFTNNETEACLNT